ncbi:MAG: MoxR family ATPase [Planctomycetota bacterium]
MPPSSSQAFATALQEGVGRALIGRPRAVQLAVITLLARGHLLVEDRPGVGKTLLARAIARCLGLPFQRVQCTADLLPADIVGAQVYHPGSGDLSFRPGPVFTSVLVADELNRTPPRTQSALLECMQERRVSVDRQTHDLPEPFFVVATQNPVTFAGTYPLPESQLDRFLIRTTIGHPDAAHEAEIVAMADGHERIAELTPVADGAALLAAQEDARAVRVDASLVAYIVELAARTRSSREVRLGVSTRGAQALHRACRARAVTLGRDYVTPDDIRELAPAVFTHRLIAKGGEHAAEAVIEQLLHAVASPD